MHARVHEIKIGDNICTKLLHSVCCMKKCITHAILAIISHGGANIADIPDGLELSERAFSRRQRSGSMGFHMKTVAAVCFVPRCFYHSVSEILRGLTAVCTEMLHSGFVIRSGVISLSQFIPY